MQDRDERTARNQLPYPRLTLRAALLGLTALLLGPGTGTAADDEKPRVTDDRLTIELFAGPDQLATPIGAAADRSGRIYVIESHTHARPGDYEGPDSDRVRRLADTDGDGRADEAITFADGFELAVDVEIGPTGAVYVASRYAIHRLRDTDGDGKADQKQRIIRLDTEGNDPHDGLHGLSFDFRGRLHFGFGENAGRDYAMIGTDGRELTGGGEGGSVYRCEPDGSDLQRLAIGFWNPTSSTLDPYGRLLVTDNDPDSSPPNRLIHIVRGGHYGFEYRYGRSGLHPLQTWNGGLPGTLPMAHGTGEAATDMILYESDGLPDEYRGRPMVASWADHRVEHFVLNERGASLSADRHTLVEGGLRFRPVGVTVGPDGSLFISDWIEGQYGVHGKGRIWRIRQKEDDGNAVRQSADPGVALFSNHRPTRIRGAMRLATGGNDGRNMLRKLAGNGDAKPRLRAVAIQALTEAGVEGIDLAGIVEDAGAAAGLRILAARLAVERGDAPLEKWTDAGRYPSAVRAVVLRGMNLEDHRATLLDYLDDDDPFLRTAAIDALSRSPAEALSELSPASLESPAQRVGVLLAQKRAGGGVRRAAEQKLGQFLDDPHPDVRFVAVKWIADRELDSYREPLEKLLTEGDPGVRLYRAVLAAIDHLEGREPRRNPAPGRLFETVLNTDAQPRLRSLALRLIDPGYGKLTLKKLDPLLHHDDAELRLEAVRTLQRHPDEDRFEALASIASDEDRRTIERAEAIVGLSPKAKEHADLLMGLSRGGEPTLRREALRALVGVELSEKRRAELKKLAEEQPSLAEPVARVLGTERPTKPDSTDLDAWIARIEQAGDEPDPEAGRRVFFSPKIGTCASCHEIDGRGNRVGPQLSGIGRDSTRRSLLRAILQPNENISPAHRLWQVETRDGEVRLGMALRKGGRREIYRDATGNTFRVTKEELVSTRELNRSLMPPDLPRNMTAAELRDLLAYLMQRR